MEIKINKKKRQTVLDYYKRRAKTYHKESYVDPGRDGRNQGNIYRANHIVNHIQATDGIKTILDVGCGTCGPMVRLLDLGYDVKGTEISPAMLEEGKVRLKEHGYSEDLIKLEDFQLNDEVGNYDCILSIGSICNMEYPEIALLNARKKNRLGGSFFCEFNNALFSLFSLNKYTRDFSLDLVEVNKFPTDVQVDIKDYYDKFTGGLVAQGETYNRYDNPLFMPEMFKKVGYSIKDIYYYHFHCLPPVFEARYKEKYQAWGLEMEDKNDWRGIFMASAFVVEAIATNTEEV